MVVRGDVGSQQGHYRIESASQMDCGRKPESFNSKNIQTPTQEGPIGMHVRLSSDIKLGIDMDHSVNECKMLS